MRTLIFILTLFLFQSCRQVDSQADAQRKLDTISIIHKYPNGYNQELIYTVGQDTIQNIAFDKNGDTLKGPTLIYINDDSTMFAFIPFNKKSKCDIYVGLDSAKSTGFYLQVHHKLKRELKELRISKRFAVPIHHIYNNHIFGIFKHKTDSLGKIVNIDIPFKTLIK